MKKLNSDNKEIEIKIKIDNAEALFKQALGLGGKELKDKEGLERDVMYANDNKEFVSYTKHAPKKVLRLRKAPFGNLLTYKEKLDKTEHAYLLERTEIETFVDDYEAMHQILDKLGFRPYRIKEKYTKKIQVEGLIIEFHKLPFTGDYLEIEGEEQDLKNLLNKLGLKFEQGINKDYTQLFYDFCEQNKISIETPQTFDEEKKFKA